MDCRGSYLVAWSVAVAIYFRWNGKPSQPGQFPCAQFRTTRKVYPGFRKNARAHAKLQENHVKLRNISCLPWQHRCFRKPARRSRPSSATLQGITHKRRGYPNCAVKMALSAETRTSPLEILPKRRFSHGVNGFSGTSRGLNIQTITPNTNSMP